MSKAAEPGSHSSADEQILICLRYVEASFKQKRSFAAAISPFVPDIHADYANQAIPEQPSTMTDDLMTFFNCAERLERFYSRLDHAGKICVSMAVWDKPGWPSTPPHFTEEQHIQQVGEALSAVVAPLKSARNRWREGLKAKPALKTAEDFRQRSDRIAIHLWAQAFRAFLERKPTNSPGSEFTVSVTLFLELFGEKRSCNLPDKIRDALAPDFTSYYDISTPPKAPL